MQKDPHQRILKALYRIFLINRIHYGIFSDTLEYAPWFETELQHKLPFWNKDLLCRAYDSLRKHSCTALVLQEHNAIFWGFVLTEDAELIVIGPVYERPLDHSESKLFAKKYGISPYLDYDVMPNLKREQLIELTAIVAETVDSEKGAEVISDAEITENVSKPVAKGLPPITKRSVFHTQEEPVNDTYWITQRIRNYIMRGDYEGLASSPEFSVTSLARSGKISNDPFKQFEYISAITISGFMAYAIEAGVYPPDANKISDASLHLLTETRTIEEMVPVLYNAAYQFCKAVRECQRQLSADGYVDAAKYYLKTRLTQPVTLEEMSEQIGISKYYLCRLFRESMNKSPIDYLLESRVNAACELLINTTEPIAQIAELFCFCNQSYFSKTFRKYVGMSPKDYRSMYRNHPIAATQDA